MQRKKPITHHTRITKKSQPKIQSYHVSGKVEVLKTYSKIKDGNTVVYDKEYHDTQSVALTVQASSTEDAIKQFNIEVQSSFNIRSKAKDVDPFTDEGGGTASGFGPDSPDWLSCKVNNVSFSHVVPDTSYHASSEMHSPIRSASHVIYDFFI